MGVKKIIKKVINCGKKSGVKKVGKKIEIVEKKVRLKKTWGEEKYHQKVEKKNYNYYYC